VDTFFGTGSYPQDKGNARRENTNVVGEVRALGTDIHFQRSEFQYAQVDGAGSGPLDAEVPGLPPGVIGSGDRVVEGVRVEHAFALAEGLVLEARAEDLQNTMGVVYPESKVGDGVFTSGDTRTRFTGGLTLKWTLSPSAKVLLDGGVIQDWERSVTLQGTGGLRAEGDPTRLVPQITLDTTYVAGEYDQRLGPFGLTLGGRYEDNDLGNAFAPRAGLTWASGPFFSKLLYGQAFREPTIFQEFSTLFTFQGYVKPEIIRSREFEFGWHISPNLAARVNLFRMSVTRCIEGSLTPAGDYFIENEGSVHSKGVEARVDGQYDRLSFFGNLCLTRPDGEVIPFYLASDGGSFLGVPQLKVNLGASLTSGPFQVGPSLSWTSQRQAQTPASAQSGYQPDSVLPVLWQSAPLPARLIANLSASWKGCLGPGTTGRFTITNLGNVSDPFIQPYYGDHAPQAANDRSFTLDLVWTF
jgi:hypothetical protein